MNRKRIVGTIVVSLAAGCVSAAEEKPSTMNAPFYFADPEPYAERWEREGREVYDRRMQILEACGVSPGMTVADVGAGTGLFTRLFSEKVGPGGKVFAVDISGPFIDHILRKAEESGVTNIKGIRCLPDDTGLPRESTDLVFICDTYHHFEYPEKTMRSVFEGMKPGATLVVVDFKRVEGQSSDWVLSHVRAGAGVVRAEIESVGFLHQEDLAILDENFLMRFRRP